MIGIYMIKNKINGKIYIGQSQNIQKRWNDHFAEAYHIRPNTGHYPINRAIRKYGKENFECIVLKKCNIDELDEIEITQIKEYDSTNPDKGYNVSAGGAGVRVPKKISEEIFWKIIDDLQNTRLTQTEIGEKYGVLRNAISEINTGKCHVKTELIYPIRKKGWFGKEKRTLPISLEEAQQLIARYGYQWVSNEYNIAIDTIKARFIEANMPYSIKDIIAHLEV